MTIEIGRLGPGDAGLFDRVADGVFDHAIDRSRLAAYLAAPQHHFIAALASGEIVGQLAAVVHRHPDGRPIELYVDEVGVAPAFQRRGIARRMVDEAFALGRELGCEELWVATEPDNLPAKTLYETRGAAPETVTMYVYRL